MNPQILEKQKQILETIENSSKTILLQVNGYMQITKFKIKSNTTIQEIEQDLPILFNTSQIAIATKISKLYQEFQQK